MLRTVGLAIAGGLALESGIYVLKWIWKKVSDQHPSSQETTFKTLFFPDRNIACKDHFIHMHGCSRSVCKFSHNENSSYGQLLRQLGSARSQIDVAVYCITGRELVSVLVDLHKLGVVVRVMCDNEQVDVPSSQIGYLRAEGIQVRHDRTAFYMHHKFVIIDGKVLVNGSFNWSRNAITGNNENVMITNHSAVVKAYQQEYDKLWEEFDPKND